jgi:uncharacterized YccA/Bax inhibitor family protein
MVVVAPRIVPTETPVNKVFAGVVDEIVKPCEPSPEVPLVVTDAPLTVNDAVVLTGAALNVIVNVADPTTPRLAVAPTADSVGVPAHTSPVGRVSVMVLALVNWSAFASPTGSEITIGLMAVVAEAPNVTAGVLDEAEYHRTVASVGTVNEVDAAPEVA